MVLPFPRPQTTYLRVETKYGQEVIPAAVVGSVPDYDDLDDADRSVIERIRERIGEFTENFPLAWLNVPYVEVYA